MATPILVRIPHQLGRAEARRRIEAGLPKLVSQLPGGASVQDPRWDGDRLSFSLAALGQTIPCGVEVLDTAVTLEVTLSGLLGQMAGAFKDRLQKAGQALLTAD